MRDRLSRLAVRIGARLMTWGYTERAKLKGWTADQVKATREIAKREENWIWDTIRGQILWNKSEGEVVASRLARRYDPGMAMNEMANRALAAKLETRGSVANPPGHTGEPLTARQLAALEFQTTYLKRVVKS